MPPMRSLLPGASATSALLLLLGACTIDPGNSDRPQASSNPANADDSQGSQGGAAASNSAKGGATASNSAKGGAAASNGAKAAAGADGAMDGAAASNGAKAAAGANGAMDDGATSDSHAGRTGTQPDPIASSGSGNQGELEPPALGSTGGQAGEPPAPCDLEGHCDPKSPAQQVTCGVVAGDACEFAGFIGATADVSLGQRAVIGTACCGACECVPVEVYFDGKQCWQGLSGCIAQLLNPHPTTAPNPAFSPPPPSDSGSFYLGSAGSAGETAGGSAGGAGGAGGASGAAGTATSPQGGGGSAP